MSAKLVVCVMGQNAEKFIGMCLESVKDADAIVYCDGGSTDKTLSKWTNFIKDIKDDECENFELIENKYDQSDKAMNGKQRNFYLKYLKENYPGWICLCMDADEVLAEDGIKKIKEMINGRDK